MALELPETFLYEKRGRIAVMTINRPRAMNAFTGEMLAAMDACLRGFPQGRRALGRDPHGRRRSRPSAPAWTCRRPYRA
jgi:Ser/Thr protein kinase RdoA (MazF antagonist)